MSARDADRVSDAAQLAGLEATVVTSVAELIDRIRAGRWTATVLSLAVDLVDAEIARRVGAEDSAGALFVTAPGITLERALDAERAGSTALLREPIDSAELGTHLSDLRDDGEETRLPELPSPVEPGKGPPRLIGDSSPMEEVFRTVARVSDSITTVLLTGESGTGKEVVARAVHWASQRRDRPFVAVNCAAIPEHLLESELFGHERGAFTGAVARRAGRFERAAGGTLFLDEIGDMSLVLQAKVLRALEERVVERVGGAEAVPVDVRVIAATNRDLARAIADGSFREDLYFRLAVVEVWLPPLRERGRDVRALALHFGAHFARGHGRSVRAISEKALARLQAAPWPGNVRELRNVMDRAVLLTKGETIRSADLRIGASAPTAAASAPAPLDGYSPTLSLEAVESDHIRRVLAAVDGHIGEAAQRLGIHRNTLTRKMKAYGLRA